MGENYNYYFGHIDGTNIIYLAVKSVKLHQEETSRHEQFARYCIGNIQYVLDLPNRTCTITSISVAEQHQGKGIATELFRKMIDLVKYHDIQYLELDCMTNIPDDKNVFMKWGFRYKDKSLGPEMIADINYVRI